MDKKSFFVGYIVIISGLLILGTDAPYAAEQSQSLVLFDFGRSFDIGSVVTSDAKVMLPRSGALRIETGHKEPWPGITLKAPAGKWDLSKYEYVSIYVDNIGTKPVTVYCRVDNPGADGSKNCVTNSIALNPKTAGTLVVRVFPTPWRLSEPAELGSTGSLR